MENKFSTIRATSELQNALGGLLKRNDSKEHIIWDLFNFKKLWLAKENNSLISVTWGDEIIRKGYVTKIYPEFFQLKLNPENKNVLMEIRGIKKIEDLKNE